MRHPTRSVLALAVIALSLATLAAPGCNTVEFWELEALADPTMARDESPAHVHWHQKVFYSTEGAAGGIGSGAGGGCGCSN